MKTLHNKKGFTLAELLIVIAIIAVLVAIAVPVFSAQLESSREAVDLANAREASSMAMADYLMNHNDVGEITYFFAMDTNNNLNLVYCSNAQDSISTGKQCTIPEHLLFVTNYTDYNFDYAKSKKCKDTSLVSPPWITVTVEDGKITSNNWLEALGATE